MSDSRFLEKFADLTVRVGANVQPGQMVVLDADIAHAEIARAVVAAAYAAGAKFVNVLWSDGATTRSTLLGASAETLSEDRPWALTRTESWSREGAAFIALTGSPDPHMFDGIDRAKLTAQRKAELVAHQQVIMGGAHRWTVVAAPNAGWATQVFGAPDVDALWNAVGTAMRLDEPDPVMAWEERRSTLESRAKALDALELTGLRYVGDGTDLTVGLPPQVRWTGGGIATPDGKPYMPNIPTEEVFTGPDRRIASGHIRVTKPVMVLGQLVDGLTVTLEDGRITDFDATTGKDAVAAQLDQDPGARSLGEVALVDRESRVGKAGVLFRNTLYDENAACHVAWGMAYPFSIEGGLAMSDDERFERGLNRSIVHTDVVIGGEGMTVTGTGPGGTVTIIRDDEWVFGG